MRHKVYRSGFAGRRPPLDGPMVACLVTACVIVPLYLVSDIASDLVPHELVNAWLPLGQAATLILGAYLEVRSGSLHLFTPVPWFLAACALYFGFGPLIYHWGTAESVHYVNAYYRVTESSLFRTNLLNSAAVALVLGSFTAARDLLPITASDGPQILRSRRLSVLFWVLFITGELAQFGLALPYDFGKLRYTPPGVLLSLTTLADLSITILIVMVGRGRRRWWPVLAGVFVLQLGVAILELSKLQAISVLMASLLGLYWVRPQRRIVAAGALVLVAAYVALTPVVLRGRDVMTERSGAFNRGGLTERFRIVGGIVTGRTEAGRTGGQGPQAWWARLDYAGAQALAMQLHDSGRSGTSFSLAGVALVPRVLWPGKPRIVQGQYFNRIATGSAATSSAPGAFAEAYWNGGWPLVGLTAVFLGFLFALFYRYALRHLRSPRLELLPVVFIGIMMGFRIDDWFVATYVGPAALAILLHVVLSHLRLRGSRPLVGDLPDRKNREPVPTS